MDNPDNLSPESVTLQAEKVRAWVKIPKGVEKESYQIFKGHTAEPWPSCFYLGNTPILYERYYLFGSVWTVLRFLSGVGW